MDHIRRYGGINSRTLGRVRQNHLCYILYTLGFNSRTLGRVRLEWKGLLVNLSNVSIHAPWEGCDLFYTAVT